MKEVVKKIIPRKWWRTIVTILNSHMTQVKVSQAKGMIAKYEAMDPRDTLHYSKAYEWMIDESKSDAGGCGAYYWQDLWAASKIIKRRPEVHYDIGSRIDGFIAHLQAAEQNTVLIDIRKMESNMPFVKYIQADATSLDGIRDESVESISALCSLEHFGLGRYGDPIDPDACFKAMKSIQRVVKRGGHAYVAVPIGAEHVEFNAHRIFYAQTIVDEFDQMDLVDFQANTLGQNMQLEDQPSLHQFDEEWMNGANRFGLFEFVKN